MNHERQTGASAPFDVLALVASAGGHTAITTVLQGLPPDFPIPIIALQHLGPDSTGTVAMYARLMPFAVEPLRTGAVLAPGVMLVGPPRSFVDLLPDGACVVTPAARGAMDKPFDHFFKSVARSFGYRALAVVLTGMGADGALGARQVHQAGGIVLVQSEDSAEYPQMPHAAVTAGAADLVVPLDDLAQVIADLAAGTPYPQPRSELDAIRATFGETGEIATLARTIDWSRTALGPVRDWAPVLRTVLRLAMDYQTPYTVLWGPHFVSLYNDAAIAVHADHHPSLFGRPTFDVYPELQPTLEPRLQRVLAGETVHQVAMPVSTLHVGEKVETWFEFVYSPIREVDGTVGGIASVWNNRTVEVLASRRLQTLNALTAQSGAINGREALGQALAVLQHAPDIVFAVAYQVAAAQHQVSLAGAVGLPVGSVLAPWMPALEECIWPLAALIRDRNPIHVQDLATRFPGQPLGLVTPAGGAQSAVLQPLIDPMQERVTGILILGLNPGVPLDDHYQAFLQLVAETVAGRVAEAEAHARERERLERLAELDRTKTEFFANVSHEFRTPLTLLLAPLEDLLRQRAQLPPGLGEEVEVAAANARRLLRLVNSLLDFSQIETRRQQAIFEPVDLGALTVNIASAFRSAIEAAGLRLTIKVAPELQPVWVDRDMWEKIVSNLLSNAFKFTFTGEISVELRALTLHAELMVQDTGIGIPEPELPNIFKRFHRVYGAKARTVEGAGIGLAIVQDLISRLGGQVTVRSTEGKGSTFVVWIPYKSARTNGVAAVSAPANGGGAVAAELARDAARWLLDATEPPPAVLEDMLALPDGQAGPAERRGRILVADDNADLRAYLHRLLSPHWQVELVANGQGALAVAQRNRPDVILADIMMPELDGFDLLARLRAIPTLAHTAVIFLTARAGEDAAIQGLVAGADDYIAKPFSPRELVTRVWAVVERKRAEATLRQSNEKYQTLFNSIDEGFCIVEVLLDDNGKPCDYRFLEVNAAFERQTGIHMAVGRRMREIEPQHEEHWFEIYGEVALTGQPIRFERPADFLDHRWYDVYAFRMGAPADRRVGILFNDITERKRAAGNGA